MSLPSSTLERLGVAILGLRMIYEGFDEEMVRDGADDDYEPVGEFTGMRIRVQSDYALYPIITFENGECEEDSVFFFKGDDPDLIARAERGELYDEGWENMQQKEGVLYSSQILASMNYGIAPYAKGEYDFVSLLREFGIEEVNIIKPEEENGVSNAAIDEHLCALFLEEAKTRGVNPFSYVGCSYTID